MANIMILEPSAFSMKLLEYEFVKAKKKYKILYKLRTLKNIQEKPELSKVDIVLIDACLDEGSGGIDVAIQIKKRVLNIKVIIMSSVPEHSFLKKAKSCGCDGFWYKEDEESEIVSIVDRVMLGEKVFIGYKKTIHIGQPIFILIDELPTFLDKLQKAEGKYAIIKNILENFAEKGRLHKLYFILTLNSSQTSQVAGYTFFSLLSKQVEGIQLGGNCISQTILSFDKLSYKKQNQNLKPGYAFVSSTEEDGAEEIYVPMLKSKKSNMKELKI